MAALWRNPLLNSTSTMWNLNQLLSLFKHLTWTMTDTSVPSWSMKIFRVMCLNLSAYSKLYCWLLKLLLFLNFSCYLRIFSPNSRLHLMLSNFLHLSRLKSLVKKFLWQPLYVLCHIFFVIVMVITFYLSETLFVCGWDYTLVVHCTVLLLFGF